MYIISYIVSDSVIGIPFAIYAITQLQALPPGSMRIIASTSTIWSYISPREIPIIIKLYNLVSYSAFIAGFTENLNICMFLKCISDDDVTKFRYILHQWLSSDQIFCLVTSNDVEVIPFGARYFQMAWALYIHAWPSVEMLTALHPESDFDRQESAVWLKILLHDVHRRVC